ncbi:hypothetical protein E0Z10_g10182 [Xylaria hypoxylon]|uniref:Uncharacterized protein n=1 Tax=Xylaria hypoxylon TaxID=37992 RepID=A0A4Z0YPQ0_9PEZI|nr:hypothetical protein E0Z10_g10182 [Xylaria hypoxylon]
MDVIQASTMHTPSHGIYQVSLDLMLDLCDHMSVSDVYHLARSNKSLWMSLESYLYKRAAKSCKEDPGRVPNIISYGIQTGWGLRALDLAIKACRLIWPCMLDGLDDCHAIPPLFEAVYRNRDNVFSLLEANLADLNIRYTSEYTDKIDKCSLTISYASICNFSRSGVVFGGSDGLHVRSMRFGSRMHRPTRSGEVRREQIFGVHKAECSGVGPANCNSILEVAILNRNLELTEKLLADPRIIVRPVALWRAFKCSSKAGIEAILASGRLEQTEVTQALNRYLYEISGFKGYAGWIEYLVSVGAGAQQPCYYPTNWGPQPLFENSLSRAVRCGCHGNVEKLLGLFIFDNDYLMRVLTMCVENDDRLQITKLILERTNSNATSWKETYATAIEKRELLRVSNEGTIRFLLNYCHELMQSGVDLDLNAPMRRSRKTLLEDVLVTMMDKAAFYRVTRHFIKPNDFVRPLFQFGIDATLLSTEGWKLYRRYFKEFIQTRERRDEILSSYRQDETDIHAVFPNMTA